MKKATRIISEVEYTNENGDSVHSDLDFDFDLKEQMRPVLHECLDEWLDKSNGDRKLKNKLTRASALVMIAYVN